MLHFVLQDEMQLEVIEFFAKRRRECYDGYFKPTAAGCQAGMLQKPPPAPCPPARRGGAGRAPPGAGHLRRDVRPHIWRALFPIESNVNVILYISQNAGFLHGGNEVDGLPVVSDVQLNLDLKRMPGRNQDQADYLRDTLLNWSNENA